MYVVAETGSQSSIQISVLCCSLFVSGTLFPSFTYSCMWLCDWVLTIDRRVLFHTICGLASLQADVLPVGSLSPTLPINIRERGLKDKRKLCPLVAMWREQPVYWTRNVYLRDYSKINFYCGWAITYFASFKNYCSRLSNTLGFRSFDPWC